MAGGGVTAARVYESNLTAHKPNPGRFLDGSPTWAAMARQTIERALSFPSPTPDGEANRSIRPGFWMSRSDWMSVESDRLNDALPNYPAAQNPSGSQLAELDPAAELAESSPAGLPPATDGQAPLAEPVPPPAVAVDPLSAVKLRIDPETVDEAGYVSIWNVASATVAGDTVLARALASRLLGFLCKHQCDFVVTSSTDARYLDEWYERDQGLLNDWAPTSEKVDVLSQHAQVPGQALLRLLRSKGFDPTKVYSPKRADRAKWFSEGWSIG